MYIFIYIFILDIYLDIFTPLARKYPVQAILSLEEKNQELFWFGLVWFGSVHLFDYISTFMDYFTPKLSWEY